MRCVLLVNFFVSRLLLPPLQLLAGEMALPLAMGLLGHLLLPGLLLLLRCLPPQMALPSAMGLLGHLLLPGLLMLLRCLPPQMALPSAMEFFAAGTADAAAALSAASDGAAFGDGVVGAPFAAGTADAAAVLSAASNGAAFGDGVVGAPFAAGTAAAAAADVLAATSAGVAAPALTGTGSGVVSIFTSICALPAALVSSSCFARGSLERSCSVSASMSAVPGLLNMACTMSARAWLVSGGCCRIVANSAWKALAFCSASPALLLASSIFSCSSSKCSGAVCKGSTLSGAAAIGTACARAVVPAHAAVTDTC